ncbi:hypothetical protein FQN50_005156 [Emmonsiellopsis sp. PD_5]|nr:hypothetical protein FQN50_005156 [Emmonsiellopsis sp. PD_5]
MLAGESDIVPIDPVAWDGSEGRALYFVSVVANAQMGWYEVDLRAGSSLKRLKGTGKQHLRTRFQKDEVKTGLKSIQLKIQIFAFRTRATNCRIKLGRVVEVAEGEEGEKRREKSTQDEAGMTFKQTPDRLTKSRLSTSTFHRTSSLPMERGAKGTSDLSAGQRSIHDSTC